MRLALADSSVLQPVALAMTDLLSQAGVKQVVGYGYGSFVLIGAILVCGDNLTGGILRPHRKAYGFRRRLEGAVDPSGEVIIVDDVLASGRSAVKVAAILRSEGYRVAAVHTVFQYGWRQGRERLARFDLDYRCLATLQQATNATAARSAS